jgi:single-strand selective monofunctional uracil DNA glycosylase
MGTVDDLLSITEELTQSLAAFAPGSPVAHVYRPLEYAAAVHEQYITRFGSGPKSYLLVGMNPGPWGMAQTGVPFGAVGSVRDWLRLDPVPIPRPSNENEKRPVLGFECHRQEVSGDRLWRWAEDLYTTPERFFSDFWVANYCPLLFLDERGRNLTPDKLRSADRDALFPACDRALARIADTLSVDRVIGVGIWAEKRARFATAHLPVTVGRVLHPSPASPAANKGWAKAATRQLRESGVRLPAAATGVHSATIRAPRSDGPDV